MEEEDEEQKPKINGFGLGLASLQVTELLIDICKKSMKDVPNVTHKNAKDDTPYCNAVKSCKTWKLPIT